MSSDFSGTTFRAALTSAIPRFLPFCSWPARPYFLQEPAASSVCDRARKLPAAPRLTDPPDLIARLQLKDPGSCSCRPRSALRGQCCAQRGSARLRWRRPQPASYITAQLIIIEAPLTPSPPTRPARADPIPQSVHPAELPLCKRFPRSAWTTRHRQYSRGQKGCTRV